MQLGPGSHRPVSARQALPPVYFAMVMATGIVSIAVYLNGMQRLAATLMWLNVVLFIAFWILLIGRLALAPRGLLEELTSSTCSRIFHYRGRHECSCPPTANNSSRHSIPNCNVLFCVSGLSKFHLPHFHSFHSEGRQAGFGKRHSRRLAPLGGRHAVSGHAGGSARESVGSLPAAVAFPVSSPVALWRNAPLPQTPTR